MYAGIFVLAVALIVLVLWVSRLSSKLVALKQALMIEQRKWEELELQFDVGLAEAALEGTADQDAGATGDLMLTSDAQSLRQQEQMRRIVQARERQAKLKQKHSEEKAAEQRRKQELARKREEQVRKFQKQQEALRRRIEQEQAEQAAEEERLNKLRTRASWADSYAGTGASKPRQRVRLEERRQAQLRKQAEEILQKTSLGNARGTDY